MKQITDYLTAYITKSMNLSEHYSIINYTVKTVIDRNDCIFNSTGDCISVFGRV